MRVLGLDEAGRGCVLGPLVVGGFCVETDDGEDLSTGAVALALRAAGAGDSKALRPARRVAVRAMLDQLGDIELCEITPARIDAENINRLEEEAFLSVVLHFRPDVVIIDAPCHPRAIPGLVQRISAAAAAAGVRRWVVEPKADATYPVVGSASIHAKVARDGWIAALARRWGDIGSGYPNDPRTRRWLSEWLRRDEPLPDFVRKRWSTIDRLRPPPANLFPPRTG